MLYGFVYTETLLVLGGNRGGVYLDSVEAVSLTGESLQCPDFPALPNAVDGVTPTSIGPRDAPVLCGGLAEGEVYKDECFVYEPSSNSWKFLATMSEARTEYGIVQMEDNKFWVTGEFAAVFIYIY